LDISDATISDGNIFDGVIYFEDRSKVTINNVKFVKNKAVERGVLSSHSKSELFVDKSEFLQNEAEFDAAIVFIDGGKDTNLFDKEEVILDKFLGENIIQNKYKIG
jgi:hypothetical protein